MTRYSALELVERVERVGFQALNRRVQPAAGDHQQRKTGAGLFVMDADIAFFIERQSGFSLPSPGSGATGRRRHGLRLLPQVGAPAGKVRMWRTASGILSLVSFHG